MNIELLMAHHRESSGDWGEGTRRQILASFKKHRPEDDVLDRLTKELTIYWDAILEEFPELERDPRLAVALPRPNQGGDGTHESVRPSCGSRIRTRSGAGSVGDARRSPRVS